MPDETGRPQAKFRKRGTTLPLQKIAHRATSPQDIPLTLGDLAMDSDHRHGGSRCTKHPMKQAHTWLVQNEVRSQCVKAANLKLVDQNDCSRTITAPMRRQMTESGL